MLYSFHHHWHLTTNNSLCLQSTGPGDPVLLPTSYPSDHHWCLPTVCHHQAVITQCNQAVLMIQCYLLCLSSWSSQVPDYHSMFSIHQSWWSSVLVFLIITGGGLEIIPKRDTTLYHRTQNILTSLPSEYVRGWTLIFCQLHRVTQSKCFLRDDNSATLSLRLAHLRYP